MKPVMLATDGSPTAEKATETAIDLAGLLDTELVLIADAAKENEADVIVVGSRGYGRIAGVLLGSVTQRLLHVAPCPVLAVPTKVAVPVGSA